mmetsp:Transcript_55618/g.131313  ORF Transcript_55618/g.131313 Transcript_55618/m.131313 type:complete len:208 (+) Transcript_55618:480-1103(+)
MAQLWEAVGELVLGRDIVGVRVVNHLLSHVVQRPADVLCRRGVVAVLSTLRGEAGHESISETRVVRWGDGLGYETADASHGPRDGVADVLVRVLEERRELRQGTLDDWSKLGLAGPFEDEAKGEDGGVAEAPVGVEHVLLDKGQDLVDHAVLHRRRDKAQAGSRSGSLVVCVLILVFFLLCERLQQQRHKVRLRSFDVVEAMRLIVQ